MDIITGGPAFPVKSAADWQAHGMTLRDYFAVRIVQALVVSDIENWPSGLSNSVSKAAYQMADDMLQERMK